MLDTVNQVSALPAPLNIQHFKTHKHLLAIPLQFTGFFYHPAVGRVVIGKAFHGFGRAPQTESCLLHQGPFSDALGKNQPGPLKEMSAYPGYKAPELPELSPADGSPGYYGHKLTVPLPFLPCKWIATIPATPAPECAQLYPKVLAAVNTELTV